MSKLSKFLNDLFKAKYKIVPTFDEETYACNGFVIMARYMFVWTIMKIHVADGETIRLVDAYFKEYDKAITYIKHNSRLIDYEALLNK